MGAWELITNSEDAKKRVIEEVNDHLAERMQGAFKSWEESTLDPLVDSKAKELAQVLMQKVRKFVDDFERIHQELVSDGSDSPESTVHRSRDLFSKILMEAGGYNSAFVNMEGDLGFGAVLKLLFPSGGVFVGLTILFGWHPFLFFPIAAIAGLVRLLFQQDTVNEKLKEAVANQYKQQLSLSTSELAEQVTDEVDDKLNEFQNNLDRALEREIQNFSEQLEAVIADMREGQVEQKQRELEANRNELKSVNTELDGMIKELAFMKATH